MRQNLMEINRATSEIKRWKKEKKEINDSSEAEKPPSQRSWRGSKERKKKKEKERERLKERCLKRLENLGSTYVN